MLQADEGARRRLLLIGFVFVALMGGLMISGLVQRFGGGQGFGTPETDESYLARTREEIRQTREARASLEKLGKARRWSEAVAYADAKMKDKDGERPLIRFLRSEAQIYSGKFDRAAAEFTETLKGGDATVEAARLAYAGNRDEYRKFCERFLDRLGDGSADPLTANNTAWLCAHLPGGLTNYARPLALARSAALGTEDPEDRWTYLNTYGVLLYRAGQYAEAIARLREAEKLHPDPFNWPFLALAYEKTGDAKQATYWRERFRARLMDTYATNDLSQNRHELLLFFHELERERGEASSQ
jgi:tetratricopeptide (TPR) repeat protein